MFSVNFSFMTLSCLNVNFVLSVFYFIFKATAVYQAKEKLKTIDKARKGEQQFLLSVKATWCRVSCRGGFHELHLISFIFAGSISSEEIIKYAHRISASNAVCAPLNWVPGTESLQRLSRGNALTSLTLLPNAGLRWPAQTVSHRPGNAQRDAGPHGQPAVQRCERTPARWRSGCRKVTG